MKAVTSLFTAVMAASSVVSAVSFPDWKGSNPLGSWFGGRIKHVIAIMFENRSFDHTIGMLKADGRSDIDGCTPDDTTNMCYNPVDPTDPNSENVYVSSDAAYVIADPGHSVKATDIQLWGSKDASQASEYGDTWPPPMNGFIADFKSSEIMQCFNSSTLPIINTLANEFTVIDRWFADVPGPTDPNRLYAWMATCKGMGDDNKKKLAEGFAGPNIFHMLDTYLNDSVIEEDDNRTWKSYYMDAPTTGYLEYIRSHPRHLKQLHHFFEDLKNDSLPTFSWIDPGYYDIIGEHNASDEHPPHAIFAGERLLKRIYEELRKSPVWEESLLLVFYDEHGGFFDHVQTPKAVNPDGKDWDNPDGYGFNFDRLGLRVPLILVSPWVEKGLVAPRADYDAANQYSHSSLPKTIREQFTPQASSFTERDANALSFADLVSLSHPRQDCPTHLPDVPKESEMDVPPLALRGLHKPTDFQEKLASTVSAMCGKPNAYQHFMKDESTLGRFVMKCMDDFTHGSAA